MRGIFLSFALIALLPFSAAAASLGEDKNNEPEGMTDRLDSVVVSASRAGDRTPVTFSMVGKQELRTSNPIASLPMTLALQPSVVAVNEGGTGLGTSKMTVRGSKGTQINVTLNGITLNDSESQEVFWVNIPALGNLLSSVQLQRGLGTSANGAGAFGASINMSTASVGAEPYANASVGYGSYNTLTSTVSAGTGLTGCGLYFDAAYSRNRTDGYIRNAFAKVQSAYAALGWLHGNESLKLTYLMGDQHTGITWNGISLERYKTDRRYNSTGKYKDDLGNDRYYDNDSDNYTQHHVQLNYTHAFPHNLTWSTTVNFTKGDGHYENYKDSTKFTKYGWADDFTFTRDGVTYPANTKSDFIVRKKMDNYYVVLNSDLRYKGEKINVTGGINLSHYHGGHFGEVVWSKILGDSYDYKAFNDADSWYRNNARKQEINVFARAEYTPLEWLTAYADLQYRGIGLKMDGPDDDGAPLDYSTAWHFFNPRAGLTFHTGGHKAYISAALGHREPGRSDIKEIIISRNYGDDKADLKPEKMLDVEIGYQWTSRTVTAAANFYFMEYWDMLLETGRLSDVGYSIKENMGRSWRRGIELSVAWQPAVWFRLDANTTLSLNKIKDFTAYYDRVSWNRETNEWDYPGGQEAVHIGKTNMLMSPSVVGFAQLSFKPFASFAKNSFKTTTLAIYFKAVGKQYADNTSNNDASIPAYFVSNLSLSHDFTFKKGGVLSIGGYINNLFNAKYYADGWVYNMYDVDNEKVVPDFGIYPQAPINFMFRIGYSF